MPKINKKTDKNGFFNIKNYFVNIFETLCVMIFCVIFLKINCFD